MVYKKCIKCFKTKNVTEFPWRDKKKGTLRGHCFECQRQYGRNHYVNNKKYYKDRNDEKRENNCKKMMKHLSNNPCIDCGEKDIVVLQFDHNIGDKRSEVTKLVWGLYSWDTVKKEIDKCVVRCSNCHIKRHAREDKQRRFLFTN